MRLMVMLALVLILAGMLAAGCGWLGNVYVTGKSDGGTSCADYATIKYVSASSIP